MKTDKNKSPLIQVSAKDIRMYQPSSCKALQADAKCNNASKRIIDMIGEILKGTKEMCKAR